MTTANHGPEDLRVDGLPFLLFPQYVCIFPPPGVIQKRWSSSWYNFSNAKALQNLAIDTNFCQTQMSLGNDKSGSTKRQGGGGESFHDFRFHRKTQGRRDTTWRTSRENPAPVFDKKFLKRGKMSNTLFWNCVKDTCDIFTVVSGRGGQPLGLFETTSAFDMAIIFSNGTSSFRVLEFLFPT